MFVFLPVLNLEVVFTVKVKDFLQIAVSIKRHKTLQYMGIAKKLYKTFMHTNTFPSRSRKESDNQNSKNTYISFGNSIKNICVSLILSFLLLNYA